MSAVKDAVMRILDGLPEDCTFEDVQYHLYVREKVLRGMKEVDEGLAIPHDEAKRRMVEWAKGFEFQFS